MKTITARMAKKMVDKGQIEELFEALVTGVKVGSTEGHSPVTLSTFAIIFWVKIANQHPKRMTDALEDYLL